MDKIKKSWIFIFLTLAVVLILLFLFASRTLPKIAIAKIAKLTGTKIEAGSVDVNFDGSVIIKELVLRPGEAEKYGDVVFRAKAVNVYFYPVSLLTFRPKLKELIISDFIFNLQYDHDIGRWNVPPIGFGKSKTNGKIPAIRLSKGTVEYSGILNRQTRAIAALRFDANFESSEKIQDSCNFTITIGEGESSNENRLIGSWQPGSITVAGGVSSIAVPAFNGTLAAKNLEANLIYDGSSNYLLKLSVKDLLYAESDSPPLSADDGQMFPDKPGLLSALERVFKRYRPAGRLDVEIETSGNMKNLVESSVNGELYCRDLSVCDRKYPYPLEHIVGRIDLTENSSVMNNLVGEHGGVKVTVNGWSRGFGPKWQYDIQVTSDNMAMDKDLYNALSEKQKKFWSAFSPSGFASIDFRRIRRSPADTEKSLTLELHNAAAEYHKFPYPLKNITGRLRFDPTSTIISDVNSHYDNRKVVISGAVTECDTDRPKYSILIKASDIPLDPTLMTALAEKQNNFYRRFDMTGLADAEIKVFTPIKTPEPSTFTADVTLKNASMKIPFTKGDGTVEKQTSPAISEISARVLVMPDVINVESFTGRYGQGMISVNGRIWPSDENRASHYCLSLWAEQMELNDDLLGLLPDAMEQMALKLEPRGKVNFSADLNKAGDERCSDYGIAVEFLGDSFSLPFTEQNQGKATIKFEKSPFPLKDVTGRLMITKDSIELADITATTTNLEQSPQSPTIKLNGRLTLANGTANNEKIELAAGNVTVDANNLRIKGKHLSRLETDMYYDAERKSWLSKEFIAYFYDGRLAGKLELKNSEQTGWEYELQTGFEDVDLKEFLSDRPKKTSGGNNTTGKLNGSLDMAGGVGERWPRIGRCRLQINDMQVSKLSPLAKLLGVLKLRETADYNFEQMFVDSYIRYNGLFIEKFDLSGRTVAFNGSGQMDLQSRNVNMTLSARGKRLAGAEPSVLQSLTEGLGQAVVRVEVSGNVYDPQVITKPLPVIRDSLEILGTKQNE